jgi:hypothetical protein
MRHKHRSLYPTAEDRERWENRPQLFPAWVHPRPTIETDNPALSRQRVEEYIAECDRQLCGGLTPARASLIVELRAWAVHVAQELADRT